MKKKQTPFASKLLVEKNWWYRGGDGGGI